MNNIEKKFEKLEELKLLLKKNYRGLDSEIDSIIEQITLWYISEYGDGLLSGPVVINLYGFSGCGKTEVIETIVNFLNLNDRMIKINCLTDLKLADNYDSDYFTLASKLTNLGIFPEDKNVVIFDDFHNHRTVDSKGERIAYDGHEAYSDLFIILDSGKTPDLTSSTEEVKASINTIKKNLVLHIGNISKIKLKPLLEDITIFRDCVRFHLMKGYNGLFEIINKQKETFEFQNRCSSEVLHVVNNFDNVKLNNWIFDKMRMMNDDVISDQNYEFKKQFKEMILQQNQKPQSNDGNVQNQYMQNPFGFSGGFNNHDPQLMSMIPSSDNDLWRIFFKGISDLMSKFRRSITNDVDYSIMRNRIQGFNSYASSSSSVEQNLSLNNIVDITSLMLELHSKINRKQYDFKKDKLNNFENRSDVSDGSFSIFKGIIWFYNGFRLERSLYDDLMYFKTMCFSMRNIILPNNFRNFDDLHDFKFFLPKECLNKKKEIKSYFLKNLVETYRKEIQSFKSFEDGLSNDPSENFIRYFLLFETEDSYEMALHAYENNKIIQFLENFNSIQLISIFQSILNRDEDSNVPINKKRANYSQTLIFTTNNPDNLFYPKIIDNLSEEEKKDLTKIRKKTNEITKSDIREFTSSRFAPEHISRLGDNDIVFKTVTTKQAGDLINSYFKSKLNELYTNGYFDKFDRPLHIKFNYHEKEVTDFIINKSNWRIYNGGIRILMSNINNYFSLIVNKLYSSILIKLFKENNNKIEGNCEIQGVNFLDYTISLNETK